MVEIELTAEELTSEDNTAHVEMTNDEIWFLKSFIKKYHPKKIVEVGVSAGGNTVNLLNWKDKDAQLFSVDIAKQWYVDTTKLSGFMAEELKIKDNWKMYRGYDYIDVYEEIGNDIDFIIIDTVHAMPGEFLTFLIALPQLKDGCVVILHDIHLNIMNMKRNQFENYKMSSYCTGMLHGGVSSNEKWTLKARYVPNISAFVVDESTRENIKDIFHILCMTWFNFPFNPNWSQFSINEDKYFKYIKKHYTKDCYKLFKNCFELQYKYFEYLNEE